MTGPVYGHGDIQETDNDLTRQGEGEPIGERIIVTGRVVDDNGRPVPHTLIEIWQCNAAGRYRHKSDEHPAPLDPNFTGAGRTLTDAQGNYRFTRSSRDRIRGAITRMRGGRRTFIFRFSGRRSRRAS